MSKVEIDRAELDEIVEQFGGIREAVNRIAMGNSAYFRMAQTVQVMWDHLLEIQQRADNGNHPNEHQRPPGMPA